MRRVALGLASTVLAAFVVWGCAPTRTVIRSPGNRSASYLRAQPYKSMVIEINAPPEAPPSAEALELMVRRASQYCDKPGGITTVLSPVTAPVGTGALWSIPALEAYEIANRKVYDSADTVVLYLVYLDGTYAGDPNALAVSYGEHSIAVFKRQLPAGTEGATLVHELGHQLGLVNKGAPMVNGPHEDPQHPGHDVSPRCVMFWTFQTRDAEGFSVRPPDDYDDACRADLAAARGPTN